MRVLFTGGSGKAGKHVVPYLVQMGHRVLNFDRVGLGLDGVHDLIGDITDAGQVYSAMRTHAGYDEMESPGGARLFDAVVHFAAVPRARPVLLPFGKNPLAELVASESFAFRGVWFEVAVWSVRC